MGLSSQLDIWVCNLGRGECLSFLEIFEMDLWMTHNIEVAWVLRCSVVSNSLRPHGLWPTRLLCPWDFPGKNTGVIVISCSRGSSQPRDQTRVPCVGIVLLTSSFPWAQGPSSLSKGVSPCCVTIICSHTVRYSDTGCWCGAYGLFISHLMF